jgi:hypothetical protein
MQDLINSSIRLEEDILTPSPRTPPGEVGLTPTLESDPGTPIGPIGQPREPRMEIVAIIGPIGSDAD